MIIFLAAAAAGADAAAAAAAAVVVVVVVALVVVVVVFFVVVAARVRIVRISTSLPGGNQVDGLPPVCSSSPACAGRNLGPNFLITLGVKFELF